MLQGAACERFEKHPDMVSVIIDALQRNGRVQERGDGMSCYCRYINGKCKYCEEGHCEFPMWGSGYPYDAPCFGYSSEEETTSNESEVGVRLLSDGTLWIKTDKLADIGRVIVEDGKTSCKQFYQDAQPEIIYCKDCTFSENHKRYGDRFCLYNGSADIVPDLHFCGFAERRSK